MWILVIIFTLVGVFYWFSKEEKKYKEREILFQQSYSVGGLNRSQQNINQQYQNSEPARMKNSQIPFNQDNRMRNEEKNTKRSSNDFSYVPRSNYQQQPFNKSFDSYNQEGVTNRNDFRMTQSQYINTRQSTEFRQSGYQSEENYYRPNYSAINTFSQNQPQTQPQFNENSQSIKNKNPYLDPYQPDERMHNDNYTDNQMYPIIERIVKGSDRNDDAMHVEEHSPNSHDTTQNLRTSQSNIRKPTKKEDDSLSPKREEKEKKRGTGHLKTALYQNDDDEEDEEDNAPIKFVKKEDVRKSRNDEKLKERGEKEKKRDEILDPLRKEVLHEHKGNNSLKKYVQHINLKEYQFAELYDKERIEAALKRKQVDPSRNTSASTQPSQGSILNIGGDSKATANTSDSKPSGGLFGNSSGTTATTTTTSKPVESSGVGLFAGGTGLNTKPTAEPDKKSLNPSGTTTGSGLFAPKPGETKSTEINQAEKKPEENKLPENRTPVTQQTETKSNDQKTNPVENKSGESKLNSNPTNGGGLFANSKPSTTNPNQGGLFGNASTQNPSLASNNQTSGLLQKPTTQDALAQPKLDENGSKKPEESIGPVQNVFSNPPNKENGITESKPLIQGGKPGGLFGSGSQSSQIGGQVGGIFGSKPDDKSQNAGLKNGLFGNMNSDAANTKVGTLSTDTSQNTAPKNGLFGNITSDAANTKVGTLPTQSNTGNNLNNSSNNQDTKNESSTNSIPSLGRKDAVDPSTFSMPKQQTNTTNNDQKPAETIPKPMLFGQSGNPKVGVFAFGNNNNPTNQNVNPGTPNTSTLFGNTSTLNTGILANTTLKPGSSLFSKP